MQPREQNPRIERVRFALRASGIKPQAVSNPLRSGIHSRGYLPHIKREGASYFVTFRLVDSLPKEVLMKFQQERAQRLQRLAALRAAPGSALLTENEQEIERDYYRKVERYLDRGAGACYLRRPEIARIVADAIGRFQHQRYLLRAWVVMPNHAHAVIWPLPSFTLSEILKSWKGYSAREANKLLHLTGTAFWQEESFDHWIRNDEEQARFCRYVLNNPVKARLCAAPAQWRWSSAWCGPKK